MEIHHPSPKNRLSKLNLRSRKICPSVSHFLIPFFARHFFASWCHPIEGLLSLNLEEGLSKKPNVTSVGKTKAVDGCSHHWRKMPQPSKKCTRDSDKVRGAKVRELSFPSISPSIGREIAF